VLATTVGLRELARSRTVQVFGRIVARVDAPERVVALTLDGGPMKGVLHEIVDVLAKRRVRATFFVTGVGPQTVGWVGARTPPSS
jgi:peptidoglycan/xylan/chitin deacetylase (PgdA/CDA1 family)